MPGSKRLFAVKEIKKLQRGVQEAEQPTGIGGGTLLATPKHQLEGAEHLLKSGALLVRNVISPAQLVANTDNWSPTDLATADAIRVSTDASRNLTGIAAPASGYQAIVLENIGTHDLVLKHNATSTAANRFYCPNDADMTLQKDSTAILLYDLTSTRWRIVGGGGSSGGSGHAITEDGGSALTTRSKLDFRHGLDVSDDSGSDSTRVAVDESELDHGTLAGLGDDDHPQYTTAAEATTIADTEAASAVSTHDAASDPHPGYVLESLADAKGDLFGASADNTPAKVAAGSEGQLLVNRAAATPGVAFEDQYGGVAVEFNGGGAVLTTGVKGATFRMPYAATLVSWTLEADVSGSIVIDIWKHAYVLDTPPVVADTIIGGGGTKPTLASHQSNTDSTLTGYGTSFAQGDVLRFNIDSATTVKQVTLTLRWKKV